METFVPKGNIYGPILPQFVLERKITLGAKIMYALLCNYAHGKDHCWPSHRTLATRLSCSVSSVKNYLSELVTSNLISITRGQCRSSVYHLLLPEELRGKEVKSDCPQPEIDCGEPNYGYINNLSKQSEEKNPPLPLPPTGAEPSSPPSMPDAPAARGVSPSAHDFESVWKIYPKQEAKGFALSAWRKLQRDCDLPPLNELLSALQRFMASDSWQREQGRFVPQLGNWLRGKRWLDPITPATAPVSQSSLGKSPASLAYEENEKRRREQQDAEKKRLRPLFDDFASKFSAPFHDAMAFGTWLHLHSQKYAPVAADVPQGNSMEIMDFLDTFKRKRQAAEFRAKEADVRISRFDFVNGDFSRPVPVFHQLFSGNQLLRQAV